MTQENKTNLIEQDMLETKNKVVEAAPFKKEIVKNYNEQIKMLKKDFTDLLFDAFPEFRDDKECNEHKEIKKVFKLFIDNFYDYQKREPNVRTKLEMFFIKIIWLVSLARYLGFTEIENILTKFNLKINTKDLKQVKEFFNNEGVKDTFLELVNNSLALKEKIVEKEGNINNIYHQLDSSIKFDSKSNPSGLKENKFNSLINLEVLKNIDQEKAKGKLEKLQDSIDNKTLSDMFIKTMASEIVNDKNE